VKAKVLVVDDDSVFQQVSKVYLQSKGFAVELASDGEQALAKYADKEFDIVMSDLNMAPMDGISFLKEMRKLSSDTIFLMVTGESSLEKAVEAMRLGADDYIVKPWNKDSDELLVRLEKLMEKRRAKAECRWLRQELKEKYPIEQFLGRHPRMQQVFKLIDKVAAGDTTVLLLGETGTGKELAAHAIHAKSGRRDNPMIVVNCPAYAENLLESELFGHEKGAFTGADKQKKGRFELAHGGTLFLDEVGDLPLTTQAKLLRFLQEKEFERVGGIETIQADVRVIAATNLDLKKMIEAGRFRSDLFFRLNVFPVNLPSLRERKEDIPLLAEAFLKMFNAEFHKNIRCISPKAADLLLSYVWPGNVRELQNVIERAVLMEEADVISEFILPHVSEKNSETAAVPAPAENGADFPSYDEYVQPLVGKIEKEYFSRLLDWSRGNIKLAFEKAGVSRNTISRKMKEYGFDKWDFKE